MRVEEVVGRRVREIREGQGMTQEQLGMAIGELLGKTWPRQTVSAAEAGRRAFTAVELVAIARALRVYVGHLFTPSLDGSAAVELSPGVALDREEVMGALIEQMDAAADRTALALLIRSAENLGTLANGIRGNAQFLLERLGGLKAENVLAKAEKQPVVAAIVTSDLGVLVGRRNDGKPPWTFIAGEQDAVKDENPADTVVREVKEETGLLVMAGAVIGEREHPATHRQMINMAATPTQGTDVIVGDEDELAEVRWVSLAEADELLPGMFGPVREHLARELGGAGEG